jgi:hypothetical protein
MEVDMDREALLQNPHFQAFCEATQQCVDQLRSREPDPSAKLQAEQKQLEEQCSGWRQSLGNPNLPQLLRSDIERDYGAATERLQELNSALRAAEIEHRRRPEVDPEAVAEEILRLDEVLAGSNASVMNLVLAQHIDHIDCDASGQVVIRSCRLGILGRPPEVFGAVPPAATVTPEPSEWPAAVSTPHRRARRDVGNAMDEAAAESANEFAVRPDRFAGLGPEFFTEHPLQIPRRLSWAEQHCREVAEYRLRHGVTMASTAAHFEVTVPTIRAALHHARDLHGLDAFGTKISEPNHRCWAKENASAVAEFFAQPGATMKAAEAHFGKSQPTISKARRLARESDAGRSQAEADGRG